MSLERIGIYLNNLGTGGAETLAVWTAVVYKRNGIDVCVITASDKFNDDSLEFILQQESVPLYRLDTGRYNPLQVFKLWRIVNSLRLSLIHTHVFPTFYYASVLKYISGVKLVKTEHNNYNRRRSYSLLKYLENFVYGKYSLIIAITDSVERKLEEWLTLSNLKTCVIHNGIRPLFPSRSDLLENGKYNIVMVATWDGLQKRQDLLLDAMSELPTDVCLYFYGSVPDNNLLPTIPDDLSERVFICGISDCIADVYNSADLVVLATNYEGFSGVTLEAMSLGVPFLGSNVLGVKDIVGDDIHLFDNNVDSLVEKIMQVRNSFNYRNALTCNGRRQAELYSIEKMAENYLRECSLLF